MSVSVVIWLRLTVVWLMGRRWRRHRMCLWILPTRMRYGVSFRTSIPMRSFIVRLGRLSIWPKMTTKWLRSGRSMPVGRSILPMSARNWTARCSISVRIMCSTGRERSRGSRTARITSPSTFMARPSSKGNWPFRRRWKNISASALPGYSDRTARISSRLCSMSARPTIRSASSMTRLGHRRILLIWPGC